MSESESKHFEWHRERALREKQNPNHFSGNRVDWLAREVDKKHGKKAVTELVKEFNSRSRSKRRKYFT